MCLSPGTGRRSLVGLHGSENARFVWQRLDSTFQEKHPEAAAVWGLAVHLWKKDLPGFYKATNHKWSTSVGRAISHVVQAVRAKQFDIIATAYDAIAVSDAAAKLGIDQESAVSRAREAGWGVDGAFLRPVRSAGSGAAGEATAKQLGALTDYVVHLERKVGDVEDDADLKAVVARSSTEAKRGAGLAEMESAGPRM